MIDITLIGCGGTGSQMLTGLGQMHVSLRAMHAQEGHRCQGLRVTVYDPDEVTQFNIGRQMFYQTDIGMNKAECLVSRVNLAYGVGWAAISEEYSPKLSFSQFRPDVIITCVDTAAARRSLHKTLWNMGTSGYTQPEYWLDCANLATVGQVVLGQPGKSSEKAWPRNKEFDPGKALWKGQKRKQISGPIPARTIYYEDKQYIRLPCVTELFPDLMDENFDETDEPSCSMVDALKKQSLFVNRTVSAYALDLLWELIREGSIENQGCYFNLRTRTANPIPLKVWPVEAKQYRSATDKRSKVKQWCCTVTKALPV